MSRKTRKLIWSVPLIAAVAVIGALAAFVVLVPGGVLAHGPGPGIAAHLPPDPVTGIGVTTPTVDDDGRTSLRVTWNAPAADPAAGDAPTMYRVDMSSDARIWHNVIGGEGTTDVLTESMAMSDCETGEAGNRCYTVEDLDPGATYHFRVFAMNDFGTSPISIMETIGTGTTLSVEPPSVLTGLTATTYFRDKIVLTWDAPADNGGADLKWFCITLASSPDGPFSDLALDAEAEDCKTEANATSDFPDVGVLVDDDIGNDEDNLMNRTIVIAAKDEDGDVVVTYEHKDLGALDADLDAIPAVLAIPEAIALRYRLYAVTDDGAKDENRRISRAASNTATGRTVASPESAPAPSVRPAAPLNLRAVAFSNAPAGENGDLPTAGTANQGLYFYWNNPGNFPAVDAPNWAVEVERVVPDGEGSSEYQHVVGLDPLPMVDDYATPQFAVDFDAPAEDLDGDPPVYGSPTLWGTAASSGQYRVRYVNPGADKVSDTDDDVEGAWARITIRKPLDDGFYLDNADHVVDRGADEITTTLPIILKAMGNGEHTAPTTAANLRFTRHPTDPKNRIDLRWQRNTNANDTASHEVPTGYVIDRSSDQAVTWERLARADQPTDLGQSTSYTDSDEITPGKKYTYRVFPVVLLRGPDAYGLPAQIDASSEQADVPAKVTGLRVDADGQTKLKLTWNAVTNTSGHDLKGYLVQVANDDNNDGDLADDAMWTSLEANTGGDGPTDDSDDPITVGKDALTYTYDGSRKQTDQDGPMGQGDQVTYDGIPDPLTAGSERWFRVIAITNENDGIDATGGEEVIIATGAMDDTPSSDEISPTTEDISSAEPENGTTASLTDPTEDGAPAPPEVPLDLTTEAASDSNDLGDGGRGIFLTWNEAEDPDTDTASYKIERMRMNTGVDALNDTEWQFVGRANGDTSFTDRTPLREDADGMTEETRMYRVGSEATGQTKVQFVDPAVDYGLHLPMHDAAEVEFSAPTSVAATSSGGTITLTWTPGALATSQVIIAVNYADDTDYCLHVETTGTLAEHDCVDLTVGANYVVLVIALDGQGNYMLGYGADGMLETHVAQ